MTTYITDEVKKVDSEVFKLAGAYRPKINPVNSELASEHTIGGKQFEFEYEVNGADHSQIKDELSAISVPSGLFSNLYKDKIQELKIKLSLAEAIGTDDFSKKSKQLYGFPKRKLVDKAYSLLELPRDEPEVKIDISDAKQVLEQQLLALKIDWKVSYKKMLTSASVIPEKKEVKLSSSFSFSENTIRRLAIHEIGTHGVRAMNGRLQPLRIFRNFPGYMATEEGLAVFNEEITGLLNNDSVRQYAGRVVAIAYAENHTLAETYKYLCKYFDKETACMISLRVKRGLKNSDSLGSYSKDYVYLKGLFNVEKYAKTKALKYLYYGKVSLEHIKVVQKVEPELNKIKYFPPLIRDYEIRKRFFSA
jgi:uncharacterized protein (TIGR02421 family)